MATYNENSLKVKKSDLIIYIIALIAFILMIVVLMSDRIGVNKNVNSLITTDNVNTPIKSNFKEKENIAKNDVLPSGENKLVNEKEDSLVNRQLVEDLKNEKKLSNSNVKVEDTSNKAVQNNDKMDKSKIAFKNKDKSIDNSSERAIVKKETKPVVNKKEKPAVTKKAQIANRKRLAYAKPARIIPRTKYSVEPDAGLRIVSKVRIRYGDALWKIASRHGVRTINIIYVNKLKNPDLIYPGQVINIPNK